MTNITDTMTQDHRRCDELFSVAEATVNQNDWDKGTAQAKEFISAMEHHFTMEEQVLFPAFENRTGMTGGPTQVMRAEHQQMRQLLMQLQNAVEAQQRDEFLNAAETLLIMMQQHNAKEQGMLYPMADAHLGGEAEQILAYMEQTPP